MALKLLDQAVALAPDFALASCNRGVALLALKRTQEAQAAFIEAVRLQPVLLEAQRGLAAAPGVGRPGRRRRGPRRRSGAGPCRSGLIEGLAELQLQLAARARTEGDLTGAIRLTGLAARTPGRRLEALVNGSDLLERLGRYEESWSQGPRGHLLDPASPYALNNLGVACLRLNRAAEAERAYRAALACAPAYVDAHHGLAFALLKQGRFAEGWPEYEWRLRTSQAMAWTQGFDRPLWRGDVQPGATLLLAAEQGLGDTLQGACLIAEARRRVASVVVQAPPGLTRLIRRMPEVAAVAEDGAPRPPHDLWLPMMSLPGRLGLTPNRRPPVHPPLAADAALSAMWRERRLPREGLRVGVAWQGNPGARVEHGRSFPLTAIEPLAAVPPTPT